MGRNCAAEGCRSGRKADMILRKQLGLRQPTLFSIPKRNNALQVWSKAIGKNLTAHDAICELHFSNNSIVKEDRTVLSDGTLHIMPRQKYALVPNAVPNAIAELENIEPTEVPNRRNEASSAVSAPVIPKVQIAPESVDGKKVEDPLAEASIAAIVPKHLDDEVDISDFDDQLLESSSKSSHDDAFNFVGRMIESSDEDSIYYSEANTSYDDVEVTPFVIDDIFEHLARTVLPETWCWATNRRDKKSIVFVKIDPYTYELAFRLTLYNDLSVKAYTSDGKIGIELESTVTSIQSLDRLLEEMGKKIVCRGTGMTEESRDEACFGFVVFHAFSKQVATPRCKSCRRLRLKIQNRNNKRRKTLNIRYARIKQQVYKHLQKK